MEPMLNTDPGVFDRARARVDKMGAMARVALELTGEQQDDWTLHQARLVIKKWRYRIECVDNIVPGVESHIVSRLREIQEASGAIQDRAELIATIERFCRQADRPGLQSLIAELEAEKHAALKDFQRHAARLKGRRPASREAVEPAGRKPVEPAVVVLPPGSVDDRWERMASWLLEKGAAKKD